MTESEVQGFVESLSCINRFFQRSRNNVISLWCYQSDSCPERTGSVSIVKAQTRGFTPFSVAKAKVRELALVLDLERVS